MNTPYLTIDLSKLEHNILAIHRICQKHNLSLTPITKVIMGNPRIAGLYAKYSDSIGDSRIFDIKRMMRNQVASKFMLIRSPSIKEADEVVNFCHTSLNTEIEVILELDREAIKQNKIHNVIIMLEIGDLREGILLEDFASFLTQCLHLNGINVSGIGANATCFAGLIPDQDNLLILKEASKIFKKMTGRNPIVSGGGTNLFYLIQENRLPNYINHIRVGEGIVMGVDAVNKAPIEGCVQDCFMLTGEVIELKNKPSKPKGNFTHNAFGEDVTFQDLGIRKRAILNIGRLDTDLNGLTPLVPGIRVLGGSSDHLLLDVEDSAEKVKIGSTVSFYLNYSALLFAMSSDYVQKKYLE